jgi:hypothetical protein
MASKNSPKPKEINAQPVFQWWSEIIDHLILSLKDYKTEMDEETAFKAELSCYTVKSWIKRDIIVYRKM